MPMEVVMSSALMPRICSRPLISVLELVNFRCGNVDMGQNVRRASGKAPGEEAGATVSVARADAALCGGAFLHTSIRSGGLNVT